MSRTSRLTQEQKQLIRQLRQYLPAKDIANLMGISVSYCYKIIYEHQEQYKNPVLCFNLPPEEDRRRKLMPYDIENIKWLYNHNIPQKYIARVYKVSVPTIHYHILSDEKRQQLNKKRKQYPQYGASATNEYQKQYHKELYRRKKMIMEKQK